MLTIIPLAVIIIALGIILIIASRHLRQAAALEVSNLPEEREARLKNTILEKRLLRKLNEIGKKAGPVLAPVGRAAAAAYKALVKGLRALERSYRFHSSSPLPDSSGKSNLKLQQLLDEGKAAYEASDLAKAEASYLAVLKLNSAELAAYEGLGRVYLKREEWQQARETFEYITKNWPQNDQAYALLAMVEEIGGNSERAKDLYLHALSINNKVVEYHLNLAEIYLSFNDNEKAISTLQKAQALEPNNPKVLDQLLQVSILVGNKDLATEVLEKIKKANPDHGKLDELAQKIKDLP